jgi:uncharacterized protein (TIRG00374 family)
MRKYWLSIIQGAFSTFLIWHLFSNPSLRVEISSILTAANPRWLAVGLFCALLNESLAAVRWWLVLRAFGTPVSLGRVFIFCGAGVFFSLGLPGTGGGDAFRILYIMRLYPKKKLRASLTVIADRLCGLVALILALGIALGTNRHLFEANPITHKLLSIAVTMLSSVVFLIFLWWLTTLPRISSLWVPGFLSPLRKRFQHLGYVFSGIGSRPKLIIAGIFVSIAATFAHFTTYFLSAKAFAVSLSVMEIFTIMPVVDTLIAVPITLFGIGLRETLFQELLGTIYGVSGGAAALISLGGFGLQATVSLLGGLLVPFTASASKSRNLAN